MNGRTKHQSKRLGVQAAPIESCGVLRLRMRARGAGKSPGPLGGELAVPLLDDIATLGRALDNTVVLLDPAVSREHARLMRIETGWRVENVSEGNPLWVGDARVNAGEWVAILPGERLALGGTELQLLAPLAPRSEHACPDLVPASTASGETHLLGPGITLQFAMSGQRSPRAWWLAGILGAAVFLVCAVITVGATVLIGRSALANAGLGQVLAALTIPLVPVLGVSALAFTIDRYEREPWVLLLAAFLWGAVIAIPPVLVVEHALDALLTGATAGPGLFAALAGAGTQAAVAGVAEEVFKGAGLLVLLLALRDQFDNVTDGILYGVMIGAGFAMVENFVYFAVSPRGDLGFLILGRVVLGWLSHSTFTALIGAGLGYAREAHRGGRRWLAPALGFLAAVSAHTLFDFAAFAATVLARAGLSAGSPGLFGLLTVTAAYGPLFATQGVLLRILIASLHREAEVVREYLAPEVLAGAVTPDEYVLVQSASLRGLAERRALVAYGPRAYLTARALHQSATGLAFRRWHVHMGDPLKVAERQPEDAYRERMDRLRRSFARQAIRADAAVRA